MPFIEWYYSYTIGSKRRRNWCENCKRCWQKHTHTSRLTHPTYFIMSYSIQTHKISLVCGYSANVWYIHSFVLSARSFSSACSLFHEFSGCVLYSAKYIILSNWGWDTITYAKPTKLTGINNVFKLQWMNVCISMCVWMFGRICACVFRVSVSVKCSFTHKFMKFSFVSNGWAETRLFSACEITQWRYTDICLYTSAATTTKTTQNTDDGIHSACIIEEQHQQQQHGADDCCRFGIYVWLRNVDATNV